MLLLRRMLGCWTKTAKLRIGRLIQREAEVRLPLSEQQGPATLGVLNDTLRLASPDLQAAAVAALSAFAAAYAAPLEEPHAKPAVVSVPDAGMDHDSAGQNRDPDVPRPCHAEGDPAEAALGVRSSGRGTSAAVSVQPGPYVAGLAVSNGGAVRRGSAMALGALPAPLLRPAAEEVVAALSAAVQVTSCNKPTLVCITALRQLRSSSVVTHNRTWLHDACT